MLRDRSLLFLTLQPVYLTNHGKRMVFQDYKSQSIFTYSNVKTKICVVVWVNLRKKYILSKSQHNFWNANLNLVCFYSIDSAWKSIMKLCCECVTRSLASSTHPSFYNGAEISPHCLSTFPFCSNPPLWPSARRVNACSGFHPLEERLDWPIPAYSRCDMNKLLPKKLVLLLYMD